MGLKELDTGAVKKFKDKSGNHPIKELHFQSCSLCYIVSFINFIDLIYAITPLC